MPATTLVGPPAATAPEGDPPSLAAGGPTRRGSASRVLATVRAGITSAALTLLLAATATAVLTDPAPPGTETMDLTTTRADRMFERNRCSVTGFEPEVIPARAMVRTVAGRVRLTSFDRGWAVFSGEAPGELMAVCLGPEPAVPRAR